MPKAPPEVCVLHVSQVPGSRRNEIVLSPLQGRDRPRGSLRKAAWWENGDLTWALRKGLHLASRCCGGRRGREAKGVEGLHMLQSSWRGREVPGRRERGQHGDSYNKAITEIPGRLLLPPYCLEGLGLERAGTNALL